MKTSRQLERYFKGAANHWRISILLLVEKKEGITVVDIADKLNGSFKNISQHTKSLVQAGLLNKRHEANFVVHHLSPYGRKFATFIKTF